MQQRRLAMATQVSKNLWRWAATPAFGSGSHEGVWSEPGQHGEVARPVAEVAVVVVQCGGADLVCGVVVVYQLNSSIRLLVSLR